MQERTRRAASSNVKSPALGQVAAGDLCAGCGACAALAPDRIVMGRSAEGLARPEQRAPLDAAEERLLAEICPGLTQHVAPDGRRDHVLWGPWVSAGTGWATDPALRHAGASGGALSALLAHLLASSAVDAVVHVAADPEDPPGNVVTVSEDPEAILAGAGSRYAPSSPLAVLPDVLARHRAAGTRFAVVGKPCDAAALRAWSTRDAEIARAVPVVVSFFCGGVPSAKGAETLLAALGTDRDRLAAFRYRGMGWPGRATATETDGRERSMSYHDSWGQILSRHVQHRCKICADGTGKAADIVCADAWACDARGYPVFDEAPGVSLVLARTPLGERLLGRAIENGAIAVKPFDMSRLAAIQPGQRRRRQAVLARLAAQRLSGRPIPAYRGLNLMRAARRDGLLRNVRSFFGMLRRLPRRGGR